MGYGKEIILDLHNCDVTKFNREDIRAFCKALCKEIGMKRSRLFWWDYFNDEEGSAAAPPHLKGTSGVQFIMTSNITFHTLDDLKAAYINVFSCKDFDEDKARDFIAAWFDGTVVGFHCIKRK